jgi:3-oxoacyl-[acyl-carrier-protein] synthase I
MNPHLGVDSEICIVGIGAKTPVGLTAAGAAAAIRAGISGFRDHSHMVDRTGEAMVVASVPYVRSSQNEIDRFVSLSIEPAQEALSPLSYARREIEAVPLFIGLPPMRPGRPPDLEEQLVKVFREAIGIKSTGCFSTGHAAGLIALEEAVRQLCTGACEFCLVGGVDSYLTPETLTWIEENEQLHGGSNAYGFIPGEAAGFIVICLGRSAKRRNMVILARLRATGTAREPNLIKTQTICVGKGLTEAIRKAVRELPSPTDKIDRTVCDMNGEPYRADEYGFAIARLSQRFTDASAFIAPADCWGDVGAASGPLFAVLIAGARSEKPGYSLLWTSSESGERCAAIVEQIELAGI